MVEYLLLLQVGIVVAQVAMAVVEITVVKIAALSCKTDNQ